MGGSESSSFPGSDPLGPLPSVVELRQQGVEIVTAVERYRWLKATSPAGDRARPRHRPSQRLMVASVLASGAALAACGQVVTENGVASEAGVVGQDSPTTQDDRVVEPNPPLSSSPVPEVKPGGGFAEPGGQSVAGVDGPQSSPSESEAKPDRPIDDEAAEPLVSSSGQFNNPETIAREFFDAPDLSTQAEYQLGLETQTGYGTATVVIGEFKVETEPNEIDPKGKTDPADKNKEKDSKGGKGGKSRDLVLEGGFYGTGQHFEVVAVDINPDGTGTTSLFGLEGGGGGVGGKVGVEGGPSVKGSYSRNAHQAERLSHTLSERRVDGIVNRSEKVPMSAAELEVHESIRATGPEEGTFNATMNEFIVGGQHPYASVVSNPFDINIESKTATVTRTDLDTNEVKTGRSTLDFERSDLFGSIGPDFLRAGGGIAELEFREATDEIAVNYDRTPEGNLQTNEHLHTGVPQIGPSGYYETVESQSITLQNTLEGQAVSDTDAAGTVIGRYRSPYYASSGKVERRVGYTTETGEINPETDTRVREYQHEIVEIGPPGRGLMKASPNTGDELKIEQTRSFDGGIRGLGSTAKVTDVGATYHFGDGEEIRDAAAIAIEQDPELASNQALSDLAAGKDLMVVTGESQLRHGSDFTGWSREMREAVQGVALSTGLEISHGSSDKGYLAAPPTIAPVASEPAEFEPLEFESLEFESLPGSGSVVAPEVAPLPELKPDVVVAPEITPVPVARPAEFEPLEFESLPVSGSVVAPEVAPLPELKPDAVDAPLASPMPEAKPVRAGPAQAKTVETVPVETVPVETVPIETVLSETGPSYVDVGDYDQYVGFQDDPGVQDSYASQDYSVDHAGQDTSGYSRSSDIGSDIGAAGSPADSGGYVDVGDYDDYASEQGW